jgi:uncharacterized protein YllA (UPF0747 family)
VLRNSFLLIDPRNRARLDACGWPAEALFEGEQTLMNQLVQQESGAAIDISAEITTLEQYYADLAAKAGAIDKTLVGHVQAIGKKAVNRVSDLQGKLLRAEKRKFDTQRRQLQDALQGLFPGNGLQERVDNFMPWYARYGPAFLDAICTHSPGIPSAFVIMEMEGQ